MHNNPFIESPFKTSTLLDNLKKSGIESSLVYHSASVLYDASLGNKLLVDEAKDKTGLYLVWVAVPEFFYTEKDSDIFFSMIKGNTISAIKIFPRYHNFVIESGAIDRLLEYLDKNRLLLLVDFEEINCQELSYILDKYRSIPILLQNIGYRTERQLVPLIDHYRNLIIDISRYHAHRGIEYLCSRVDSERIVFGTGMPMYSPDPIIMMVSEADLSFREKQNISSKNLLKILKNEYS